MKNNMTSAIKRTVPDMRSVKDTAKNFGLSEHYVRQLALSGKVLAVRLSDKPNSKILINQDSLAMYFSKSVLYNDVPEETTQRVYPISRNIGL